MFFFQDEQLERLSEENETLKRSIAEISKNIDRLENGQGKTTVNTLMSLPGVMWELGCLHTSEVTSFFHLSNLCLYNL